MHLMNDKFAECKRSRKLNKKNRYKSIVKRLPAGTAWNRPTDSIYTPFARFRDTIWNCRRRERALPSLLSFGTPRLSYTCCVSSNKCSGRPRAGPYYVCSRWDCPRIGGLWRSRRTLSAGSQSGCNASGRRRCRYGCARFLWDSSDREICPASWYQNDTRIRDQRLRRATAIPQNNVPAGLRILPRRSIVLFLHLPLFPILKPFFSRVQVSLCVHFFTSEHGTNLYLEAKVSKTRIDLAKKVNCTFFFSLYFPTFVAFPKRDLFHFTLFHFTLFHLFHFLRLLSLRPLSGLQKNIFF